MGKHYNFGIEIEAITLPYGGGTGFSDTYWYRQLAGNLRNRGISAAYDNHSKYSKHPEYYGGKWFVTRDGSLKRERPYVCMEVVSPRLDTTQPVRHIISTFWEAMRVQFQPQKDISCGGHVHVTPVGFRNKFSFSALKKIAFATAAYEDFVTEILPTSRRENTYCTLNSQSRGSGIEETLHWGKDRRSLRKAAAEIRAQKTRADLCFYMQGSRYVLWNFQNIYPHPRTGKYTGTVEFRGGNQFLRTSGTMAWIAFVLGFITLALEEDLISNFGRYTHAEDPKFEKRLCEWWGHVRDAARKLHMAKYLPRDYADMPLM